MKNMKSIKELIKGTTILERAKNSEEKLITDGYIKTEAYGWEKPEYLERFGLSPNDKAIPGEWYKEYETKDTKTAVRDAFGNKTGESVKERVWTGKYFLAASQNYMAFRDWKNKRRMAWDSEEESLKSLTN